MLKILNQILFLEEGIWVLFCQISEFLWCLSKSVECHPWKGKYVAFDSSNKCIIVFNLINSLLISGNFWFILFWWEGQDCQIFCTFLQHKTSWETLDHVVWSVPKAVPCIWTSYLFVVKLCIIGENTVLCDQVLIESWWRIAYMSRSTTFPSYFRLYYTNQAGKKRANLWRRWTMKLWLLSAVITAAGEGVICIQLLAYLSDCQLHLCMEEKPASCYCCLCFDCLDSYSRVFP